MKLDGLRLNHVAVFNQSRVKAELFYGRLLGLELLYTFDVEAGLAEEIFGIHEDMSTLVFGKDDFRIEVFIAESQIPAFTAINHICFEMSDRDNFLARCHDEGLDINRIRREHGVTVFIKDFYGNLFEIKEIQ